MSKGLRHAPPPTLSYPSIHISSLSVLTFSVDAMTSWFKVLSYFTWNSFFFFELLKPLFRQFFLIILLRALFKSQRSCGNISSFSLRKVCGKISCGFFRFRARRRCGRFFQLFFVDFSISF